MKIAIFGLGYVGLTTAACLTKDKHTVIGVDINDAKVRQVNAGESPLEEPGLTELLHRAIADGRLKAVGDGSLMINECDLAIVCVGTPSAPDGSHNLSYIAEVSRQIALAVSPERGAPLTVAYRSTIRPGTMETVIRPIFRATLKEKLGRAIELVYNPEFLRETSAIIDYFAPPKIVIGTHDGKPNARMEELNKHIEAPTFYVKYPEAEFTKFVDNAFHALKVTFGNEIARIGINLGLDIETVYKIFVSDTKLNISARYLRPGGAFGGSCLPKDVRALQYMAIETGVRVDVIESIIKTNEAHKAFIFNHVTKGVKPGARVLLLGIAFKARSDDMRESPKIDLARKLNQNGYVIKVYDPWLKIDRLMGQNLGYGVSHLPDFAELMITRGQAESECFDLVIDTSGLAKDLTLRSSHVVDIDTI